MKQIIKAGATSKRLVVYVQSSATGLGLTGLTNASSGLTWYYYREDGSADVSVTLAAETLGTWTSGGFVAVDTTNMPGFYEIGVPNAVIANTNGATWAVMMLQGVANMVPVNVEIQLVQYDPTNGTNLGLTALPGTAAASTGGLPTIGTGAGNIDVDSGGRVDIAKWLGVAVTAATGGVPDVNVKNINNHAAQTDTNNLLEVDTVDFGGTAGTFASGVPVVNAGTTTANVVQWLGTAVTAATGGVPDVNVKNYNNHAAVTDGNNLPKVDVEDFGGTAGTFTSGVPNVSAGGVNVTEWLGTAVTSNAGVPIVALGTGQLTVKRNTALNGFTFPMFSSTTHELQTGLTVVSQVSIDGGALTTTANSVTELGSGLYTLNLANSDLDGTVITLIFTASGADDNPITLITQA